MDRPERMMSRPDDDEERCRQKDAGEDQEEQVIPLPLEEGNRRRKG
jgi:hypothetical protein